VTKVFMDALVIIAALISPTGGSAKIVNFIQKGLIVGIVSQTVIFEVEAHNLKINKSKEAIGRFINDNNFLVRRAITMEEIAPYTGQVDIDDIHLIAGAKLTKCNFLITLDKKHLLREDIRQKFNDFKIVSPKEFLDFVAPN